MALWYVLLEDEGNNRAYAMVVAGSKGDAASMAIKKVNDEYLGDEWVEDAPWHLHPSIDAITPIDLSIPDVLTVIPGWE